jgi:hypothetical protein
MGGLFLWKGGGYSFVYKLVFVGVGGFSTQRKRRGGTRSAQLGVGAWWGRTLPKKIRLYLCVSIDKGFKVWCNSVVG